MGIILGHKFKVAEVQREKISLIIVHLVLKHNREALITERS